MEKALQDYPVVSLLLFGWLIFLSAKLRTEPQLFCNLEYVVCGVGSSRNVAVLGEYSKCFFDDSLFRIALDKRAHSCFLFRVLLSITTASHAGQVQSLRSAAGRSSNPTPVTICRMCFWELVCFVIRACATYWAAGKWIVSMGLKSVLVLPISRFGSKPFSKGDRSPSINSSAASFPSTGARVIPLCVAITYRRS